MGKRQVLGRVFAKFRKDERGTATVEMALWVPLFVFMLSFVVNVTIVFFQEAQMLRVVQNANRAFSIGHFMSTEEAEEFVTTEMA